MMPKLFQINHFKIYYFCMALLLVGMPLSMFLMSFSQILLLSNWLLEGKFQQKWQTLKERKGIILLLSIFLIHLVGMAWSTNWGYGIHDIKIKLPLLILPLVIGTSQPLNYKQFKILLLIFTAAVIIGTLVSMAVLLGFTGQHIKDVREISVFIYHIRFALFINIAIFSLVYFLFFEPTGHTQKESIIYYSALTWLIIFQFILQSFTGIFILLIVSFTILLVQIVKLKKKPLRVLFILLAAAIPIMICTYVYLKINEFYTLDKIVPVNLEKFTPRGNAYQNDLNDKAIENGHYVGLYVCQSELQDEWSKRSNMPLKDTDKLGQPINHTLIRYLTSKGLRKDAQGLAQLNEKDIRSIESGVTNYKYPSFSIDKKVYELIWQFDNYSKRGNPSGHSVTQRIYYVQTAFSIIKENFWFGTGTGDVKDSFTKKYKDTNSTLSEKWRLRAHNQFVTFFLTFGLIGFVCILFCMLGPVIIEKSSRDYFLLVFVYIAFLSMLNEDTIETLAGSVFFAFFYAFFLIKRAKE
jgi:O-antigen ligase